MLSLVWRGLNPSTYPLIEKLFRVGGAGTKQQQQQETCTLGRRIAPCLAIRLPSSGWCNGESCKNRLDDRTHAPLRCRWWSSSRSCFRLSTSSVCAYGWFTFALLSYNEYDQNSHYLYYPTLSHKSFESLTHPQKLVSRDWNEMKWMRF